MKHVKRLLIITDSLGFPRFRTRDHVALEDTYVELLRASEPNWKIVHAGIPGATLSELVSLARYFTATQFSAVLLQAGIVDCAPRALSKFEFELAKRLRILRLIHPFKHSLRRLRRLSYTNSTEFELGIQELRRLFPHSELFCCGILPARAEYEAAVPGISRNIMSFNAALARNSRLIDTSDFPDECIAGDHHHLTVSGNRELAERIRRTTRAHL